MKAGFMERMKQQTIGVEVEMNSITRRHAARVAAEYFGTGRFKDTHLRHGYRAWSAWDAQDREWKFVYDCSIHGPEEKKTEMNTPILHYEDMELLQGLLRKLRTEGAKSDYSRGCGIHIHVGADGHTAKSLRNLANIMASKELLLVDALALDEFRLGTYCRVVDEDFLSAINTEKPETLGEIEAIWYRTQPCGCSNHYHYHSSRYHMLNYHATFTKGTVEFRLFQFDAPDGRHQNGIHAGQLKSYIQLCLAMSQAAKEARSCKFEKLQNGNPKYAMRCWLLRLGFIGEEFATAREVLTRRLAGDASFRNGRPAHAVA